MCKTFNLIIFIILFFLIIGSSCSKKGNESLPAIPNIVTDDIQKGIEKYIEEESKKGDGYYKFKSENKNYSFKLVRVHTEYLANLGQNSHFACVDLVDTKGDVYDVDFFLTGDPGNMKVTETTLHKLNGKPFYFWKQQEDKTWKRIPIANASKALKGIINDKDSFEFKYYAKIPRIKKKAHIWIPLASSDKFQNITVKEIKVPGNYREIKDKKHGNKIIYTELGPEESNKTIIIRYDVKRKEKAAHASLPGEPGKYLQADRLVPIYDKFKIIARKITSGKKSDLVRARMLYDHVIERMSYIKADDKYGRGDALYACDLGTGNCTDYHSYFISLSRSVGIPARFAIGAAIPSARNEGGISGYHCWVEFHAEGKWWPIDISEADKYSSLSTYYFGHHPANRIELSRGRDLIVDPAPASGPINFLAYPLLEIDGKQVKIKPKFSFERS